MAIRVAIIGYGAVGSIHAARMVKEPGVEVVSVYGPNRQKASAFAAAHGIPRACGSIVEAVSGADAAIICSPSEAHYAQAHECLEFGVHTLVEMPPCENAAEAEDLGGLAQRSGVKLGCAHTSRFVTTFHQVRQSIASGLLGEILEINYARYHQLRERSWKDDALLHHSAHPIDLAFFWCGGLEPKGCVALPDIHRPHTVSVLGRLPTGGAASITVTYASRIYDRRVMVVGERHTIETDGFSYMRSDLPEMAFNGDERETYEEAICRQDAEFLRACRGECNFVSWDETTKVLATIDGFRGLGGPESRSKP